MPLFRKLQRLNLVVPYSLPTVSLASLVRDDPPIREPILDDICLPPYIGPIDHDDFIPLMKLASSIHPRIIVEFGTAYGNTVANLCNQIEACHVYTVNAPAELQTGSQITYELKRDEIGRVYRRFGFEGRVTQIFENTLDLDLSRFFDDACVDLAIIDACHDTPYVINDFMKVQPFVREGGMVLFHDTHPSMVGHLVGSYTACMMLRKGGFDIRHVSNSWWAIWRNDVTELVPATRRPEVGYGKR